MQPIPSILENHTASFIAAVAVTPLFSFLAAWNEYLLALTQYIQRYVHASGRIGKPDLIHWGGLG